MLLVMCLLASVRFGAARIGTWDMILAFVDYGGSEDDLIIRTLRVPRLGPDFDTGVIRE